MKGGGQIGVVHSGVIAWLATLFVVASIASCVSPEPDPITFPFGESECASCLRENCALEIENCAGDPDCAAYLNCVNQCPESVIGTPTSDCEAACTVPDSPTAQPLLTAYFSCRDEGAGDAACGLCTSVLTPCEQCAFDNCSERVDACAADPSCETYIYCRINCTNNTPLPNSVDCNDTCSEAKSLESIQLALRQQACFDANCFALCRPTAPPCFSCLATMCAAEGEACDLDPDCYNIVLCEDDCLSASDPVACKQGCVARATVPAQQLRQALQDCNDTNCNCA